jgi:hypothetical protein
MTIEVSIFNLAESEEKQLNYKFTYNPSHVITGNAFHASKALSHEL